MQSTTPDSAPDRRVYLTGFVAALILTVIPFALVAVDVLHRMPTLTIIAIAAVIQILVHLRYFLHIDLATTPRENLLALAFAGVLIFLLVGGSLWVIFDLYDRMMV